MERGLLGLALDYKIRIRLAYRLGVFLTKHVLDVTLGVVDIFRVVAGLLGSFLKDLLSLGKKGGLGGTLGLGAFRNAAWVNVINVTGLVAHDAIHDFVNLFQISHLFLSAHLARVYLALRLSLRSLRHDDRLRPFLMISVLALNCLTALQIVIEF